MDAVKIGIIGYGYWGPNLARNFHDLPTSELSAVADRKEEQLKRAQSKFPQLKLTRDYKELLKMGLDAAVVSTPPQTHFQIAKDCLLSDLHVLVEKPLTLNSQQAE